MSEYVSNLARPIFSLRVFSVSKIQSFLSAFSFFLLSIFRLNSFFFLTRSYLSLRSRIYAILGLSLKRFKCDFFTAARISSSILKVRYLTAGMVSHGNDRCKELSPLVSISQDEGNSISGVTPLFCVLSPVTL